MIDQYTFRFKLQTPDVMVFECCKWIDEKAPIDIHRIIIRKRSSSCNCYSKRNTCKHIELVKEIIDNGLQGEMHNYMWSYENTWERVHDVIEV